MFLKQQMKSKAIPVTGHVGPLGCETSRLPNFLDNRLTDDGQVASFALRQRFTSQQKNPMTTPKIESATFRLPKHVDQ
jgi:hypothetical protein